uniref:Uncharacterized protein n=1 Tax=Arundo donax TaxID=35708 RepID=A0A0A9EDS9_ARUDO
MHLKCLQENNFTARKSEFKQQTN